MSNDTINMARMEPSRDQIPAAACSRGRSNRPAPAAENDGGMNHLIAPLEELRAEALAWLADETSRLLHVGVDPELVDGARALLGALEWAPDNRRPIFALKAAGPWDERVAELRAIYEARAAAWARAGITLPALSEEPAGAAGVGTFAARLSQVARVFDDPGLGTCGIVVVAARGAGALDPLAAAPALGRARWILLDTDDGAGAFACRIDRAAQRRELDDLLGAMIADVGAGRAGAPGAAHPPALVPPHPSDPPRVEAGGGPAHVRPLLLAIQALRREGREAALPFLREARDRAQAAGLGAEAAQMEVLLRDGAC